MTGDIGNAFPTAPCAEKVWSKCGPAFGDKAGAVIILKRRFPTPLISELDINLFVDANHGHDKITERSG
jgi:hypothetical protein